MLQNIAEKHAATWWQKVSANFPSLTMQNVLYHFSNLFEEKFPFFLFLTSDKTDDAEF
jgi:hypothetical protein